MDNLQDPLSFLNDRQKSAVLHTEGPVLIFAGAGSGKTRVITSRVAYLIREKGVKPWNIMAITFTNKAAKEMRERVDRMVGMGSDAVWVATFHSSCVRFLRRNPEAVGYERNFTIYDADDSRRLMKQVIDGMSRLPNNFKPRSVSGAVSRAKNDFMSPDDLEAEKGYDLYWRSVAEAYREYQKRLRANNAMDFDDLLLNSVKLLSENPEILENWQERFRYIMVDEYQDVNAVQFELVKLLASKYRNLCVVGDDDQSIYRFRGADIKNILGFEKSFPDAYVVKLEQNYRSTQTILDAANAVIKNNDSRRDKKLWTDKGEGEKIRYREFYSGYEEAGYVVDDIDSKYRKGRSLNDFAILYRINAQSRYFEDRLVEEGIPYSLVGGVSFYARREVKDILAYLRLVESPQDDISVSRILNVPKRGIGKTTENRVTAYALQHEISLYEALLRINEVPDVSAAAAKKIRAFTDMTEKWRASLPEKGLADITRMILEDTDYENQIEAQSDEEEEERLENLAELMSKIESFQMNGEEADLSAFLEEVSLMTDLDQVEEGTPRVLLMTVHSAKGLEFPSVYLTGLEDGIFPGQQNINSFDPSDMEEERRLMYVGITRAMDDLTLTHAKTKLLHGEYQSFPVSRFVKEIPKELLDMDEPGGSSGGYLSGRNSIPERSARTYRGAISGRTVSGDIGDGFHGSGMSEITSAKAATGKPKKSPGKPYSSLIERPPAAGAVRYTVGDRVKHLLFGEGTVKEMNPGPRDTVVTVDFDTAGTKVMYAGFAKLEKL